MKERVVRILRYDGDKKHFEQWRDVMTKMLKEKLSDADLRMAYDTMPFPAFERYHLNRFPSKGTNRAYPAKLWHACAARPVIDPDLPAVIGLDASWTRDTSAVVFDQVDSGGVHNWLAWVWRKVRRLAGRADSAVDAALAAETARQQSLDADVFVKIGPFHRVAVAQEPPILPFGRRCVQ